MCNFSLFEFHKITVNVLVWEYYLTTMVIFSGLLLEMEES